MPTIWWLLLTSAVPVLSWHLPVSCPNTKKCQWALLSGNDILLQCNVPGANWSYFEQIASTWHSNLSSVSNVETTPEGNLIIRNPLPSHTGLYQCWRGKGILVAWYELDFQDVTTLHITHSGLEQETLKNESLHLGSKELIFTQWEPWQDCDRCGKLGERKRLGYCYILEPMEGPIPCGLYLGELKFFSRRLRPEMQVEACFEQCKDRHVSSKEYVIFDNFGLEETESVWLTCPLSSIYRPVNWEANNSTLTWRGQLSGQEFNAFLDLSTGGRLLQVFQPGIYKCYVEQELVAQFNPRPSPEEILQVQRVELGVQKQQPGKADSVLEGLKLTLLMGTVLVLVGLLLKVLRSSRDQKGDRVVLVD